MRLRARRDEKDDDEGGETRRRDDGGVGGVDAFLRFANGSVVTWTRAGGRARARAVRERRVAFAARGGGAEDDGGRGEATTSGRRGSAAPLRSTIPEGGLKIDRLLDTLSGDAEGKLSNRAKFRALPIDGAIMGRIKSIIWRRRRRRRTNGAGVEKSRGDQRGDGEIRDVRRGNVG